ncbi:hypothetical protein Gotri_004944 [Gossypium trilobum]|uniref:Uncharacterized protein n=1 Tax=Gossypium trilobum TaxID=34281 RepID=A0A7J9F7G5_9ROSI|nr:hypothetical protein [Gossypium trilobum]
MVKGIGEISQGTLWIPRHQHKLQAMLKNTRSGSFQGGKMRRNQASMTLQFSISPAQLCFRMIVNRLRQTSLT